MHRPRLLILDEPTAACGNWRHDLWRTAGACTPTGTTILPDNALIEEAQELFERSRSYAG